MTNCHNFYTEGSEEDSARRVPWPNMVVWGGSICWPDLVQVVLSTSINLVEKAGWSFDLWISLRLQQNHLAACVREGEGGGNV